MKKEAGSKPRWLKHKSDQLWRSIGEDEKGSCNERGRSRFWFCGGGGGGVGEKGEAGVAAGSRVVLVLLMVPKEPEPVPGRTGF
ncbi:hypothetical protein QVD17_21108 [Tagetes erecta]|uniref:Uncharacterized protein n=1 Tax=Tagetes erecta TaxID=13708 RepID=A0AAD8KMS2_TARER|nr:hypothetical protein QVD17_21108 [Tagetes erecta]